jgi:capsular polysaccharide transport system permease protein
MKPFALTKLFRATPTTEVARLPDRPLSVVEAGARPRRGRPPRLPGWLLKSYPAILVIFLPTFLAAVYYLLIASDQYLSEARFLVRGQTQSSMSMFGQFMSNFTSHTAADELTNVADYLQSHDALKTLEEGIGLTQIYRRPEADLFARLKEKPTAEDFLEYFTNKVQVSIDPTTGLASLRARAFRPEDAQKVAETMLVMGEDVVNHFADRQRNDTLKVAREDVARAEARVAAAREQVTVFRDRESAIDPNRTSVLVLELISKLDLQLAQARTELAEASTYLKPDSAKYVALRTRVEAIEKQIANERKRLTGGGDSLAPQMAAYERLVLEREFSDKAYASAMASLETARNEASKQHLYLVRIVQPNLPEKALYPRRWLILSSLFISLCFAYGIGWLIIAGIKEHAA